MRRTEQEQSGQRQREHGDHHRVKQPARQHADGTQRLPLENAPPGDQEVTMRAEVGNDVGAVAGLGGFAERGRGRLAFCIEREP